MTLDLATRLFLVTSDMTVSTEWIIQSQINGESSEDLEASIAVCLSWIRCYVNNP